MFSPDVILYGWLGSKQQLTNNHHRDDANGDDSIIIVTNATIIMSERAIEGIGIERETGRLETERDRQRERVADCRVHDLCGVRCPWWGSTCLLYTSPSPRDRTTSRMPSSA